MARVVFKPFLTSDTNLASNGELFLYSGGGNNYNQLKFKDSSGVVHQPLDDYYSVYQGYDNDLIFDKNGQLGFESKRDLDYNNATRVSSGKAGVGVLQSDFRLQKRSLYSMPSCISMTGEYSYRSPIAVCNPIPINPNRTYKISGFVRLKGTAPAGGVGIDLGTLPIDAAGRDMSRISLSHKEDTRTTLARDLNPGDTKVFLSSISGWVQDNGVATYRRINFYDFADETGIFDDYTYSPSNDSRLWPIWNGTGAVFNASENSITLSAPWAGGAHLAGAKVAQGWDRYALDTFMGLTLTDNQFVYFETLKGLYGEDSGYGPPHGTFTFPRHARFFTPHVRFNTTRADMTDRSIEIVDLSIEEMPYYYVSSASKLPTYDETVLRPDGKRTDFNSWGCLAFNLATNKLMVYNPTVLGWTNVDGTPS